VLAEALGKDWKVYDSIYIGSEKECTNYYDTTDKDWKFSIEGWNFIMGPQGYLREGTDKNGIKCRTVFKATSTNDFYHLGISFFNQFAANFNVVDNTVEFRVNRDAADSSNLVAPPPPPIEPVKPVEPVQPVEPVVPVVPVEPVNPVVPDQPTDSSTD